MKNYQKLLRLNRSNVISGYGGNYGGGYGGGYSRGYGGVIVNLPFGGGGGGFPG